MIETECFKELNVLGPNNTPTADLLINHPPPNNENRGCFPFRRQVYIFTRPKSGKILSLPRSYIKFKVSYHLLFYFFVTPLTLEKAECSYKTDPAVRVSSVGAVAKSELGDASQLIQDEHERCESSDVVVRATSSLRPTSKGAQMLPGVALNGNKMRNERAA